MYFFFKNFFGGPSKPVPREEMLAPKFERGLPVDLSVYLSESPVLRYRAIFLHKFISRLLVPLVLQTAKGLETDSLTSSFYTALKQ